MDNTIDSLQIKINEARNKLSKESREAIDTINWKMIVLGMDNKYNSEQLENLETETELLLCGITNPEDYPLELENRMQITKEEVGVLIGDMDKLIFKKIQAELEKILFNKKTLEGKREIEIKPNFLDPRFSNMPKNVQEAIALSNWRENLYKIAQKHKLTIEQMGILEDITIKVMIGTINPDKYEAELSSKTTIAKEEMTDLVTEVNEGVLIKIRELFKKELENKESEKKVVNNEDDKIPLPPYATPIKSVKLEIKKEEETPKVVEVEKTPEPVITTIIFPMKKDLPVMPATPAYAGQTEEIKKIEESIEPVVKNFDLPNIPKNIQTPLPPKINNPSSIKHDPYREEF